MMQIYRYFKFTDFIICKFARKFIFTAFRYTHGDVDDDDDVVDDDDDEDDDDHYDGGDVKMMIIMMMMVMVIMMGCI